MKFTTVDLFGAKRTMMTGPLKEADMGNIVRAGMNVLFIGPHGTGKTQTVRSYARNAGLSMAYYNTPYLDPFIDFIGVPHPANDDSGTFDLMKSRKLIGAEIIFFDEINRCDDRIMNALFEIVQSREVSGTPLPGVRSVFAAMNPADGDYHVNDLDPALLDRFDQVIYMPPVYDAKVIAEGLKVHTTDEAAASRVAQTLCEWVSKEAQSGYVSPRKVEGIGRAFFATRHFELTMATIPYDVTYAPKALWRRLESAASGDPYLTDEQLKQMAAQKRSKDGTADDKNKTIGTSSKFDDVKWRSIHKTLTWRVPKFFVDEITKSGLTASDFANPTSSISASSIGKGREHLLSNGGVLLADFAATGSPEIKAFIALYAPKRQSTRGWQEFRKHGFV